MIYAVIARSHPVLLVPLEHIPLERSTDRQQTTRFARTSFGRVLSSFICDDLINSFIRCFRALEKKKRKTCGFVADNDDCDDGGDEDCRSRRPTFYCEDKVLGQTA